MSELNDEIFAAIKGSGFIVKLYNAEGKGPIASPRQAAYLQASDRSDDEFNLMIRLPQNKATEYSEVVIYKSKKVNDKFAKLLMTIKKIALSYGDTITIREFGRSIQAKDLGFLPKAEKEDKASINLGESKEVNEEGLITDAWGNKGKSVDTCEECNGSGMQYDETCLSCGGYGWTCSKMNEETENNTSENITEDDLGWSEDGKIFTDRHGIKSKTPRLCPECSGRGLSYDETCTTCGGLGQISPVTGSLKIAESYEKYGTTKSSYHVNPKNRKARVIIRHSKTVDENAIGARSRNVRALYVENHEGERRIIPTKSLMCARALANHANLGGGLYDSTANNILALSEDIKNLKSLKKKYPVLEDENNQKIHNAIENILCGLVDLMKCLNTEKSAEYTTALDVNSPNLTFAETFYSEKLGEGYDSKSLARGSIIFSKSRKFK